MKKILTSLFTILLVLVLVAIAWKLLLHAPPTLYQFEPHQTPKSLIEIIREKLQL